jgi:hypothetical protein
VLHVGHGGPAGHEDFEWQRRYIEIFVDTVEAADWSEPDTAHAAVVDRMNEYLPSDELQFLMELSVEPIAAQLQLTAGARR